MLERIHESQRRLLGLVNGLLDLNRLDAGKLSVEVGEVDVAQVIEETAAESREEKPGIRLDWQVSRGMPCVETDRAKLKSILNQLLSNAWKFTAKGRILVQAHPHQEGVEIGVTDTGLGIAPQMLPIIFDAFQQADSSMTRRYGGAGLGLHIVRRLLDLLGGTIVVDSEVGRGSTFRVRLPRKPAMNQAGPQRPPPGGEAERVVTVIS